MCVFQFNQLLKFLMVIRQDFMQTGLGFGLLVVGALLMICHGEHLAIVFCTNHGTVFTRCAALNFVQTWELVLLCDRVLSMVTLLVNGACSPSSKVYYPVLCFMAK
jgi:hypothetical protein